MAVIAVVFAITTMLGAAAEIPARAVECIVQTIFGGTCGDGGPGDRPDPQTTDQLTSCIGADRRQLDPLITSIPAGTNPALAYGWLLFTRAHSGPQPTSAPATPGTSAPRGSAADTSSRSQFDSLQRFSTSWPTTVTDPTDSLTTLQQLDPGTDYRTAVPAATAALLQLNNIQTVTLTTDQSNQLATSVARTCLSDSSDSAIAVDGAGTP